MSAPISNSVTQDFLQGDEVMTNINWLIMAAFHPKIPQFIPKFRTFRRSIKWHKHYQEILFACPISTLSSTNIKSRELSFDCIGKRHLVQFVC